MGNSAYQRVLQYVRERAVTYVVHQDGRLYGLCLAVENEIAFLLQRHYGFAHQMEGTQRMLEARVARPWINY